MYHAVSDFLVLFNSQIMWKHEVNFWIVFCLLYSCTSQNEACPGQWENLISQFKVCEFIIQILYILFLHKSRVTTLDMAWHQSWCDMSIAKPDYIIWIEIRTKTFFHKFWIMSS